MKDSPEVWKRERSQDLIDCRIFKIRQDDSVNDRGVSASFFVIENPDWVNVIALTKERQVLLIEQYRHGTEEVTIEIPGGMVDKGEDPGTAALRELVEETGYTPNTLIALGRSRPNPAIQNNWLYHFLAVDCAKNDGSRI